MPVVELLLLAEERIPLDPEVAVGQIGDVLAPANDLYGPIHLDEQFADLAIGPVSATSFGMTSDS